MADEINITKVRGCEEVSKPTTHIRVMADTENSPLVLKVEVTKRSKVRRKYLTYMRERTGKSARMTSLGFDRQAVNAVHDEAAEAEEAKLHEEAAKEAEAHLAEKEAEEAKLEAKQAEVTARHEEAA